MVTHSVLPRNFKRRSKKMLPLACPAKIYTLVFSCKILALLYKHKCDDVMLNDVIVIDVMRW